ADECKGLTYQEKNKKASDKWKERSYSEKKKFVDSAKVYKELNVKVSELSEEQKRKLIDRHRKKLLEEILVLEDLGCQTSTLYLDISGEVYNLGSKAGTAFHATNQDISIKFREYFGKETPLLHMENFIRCGSNQQFTIAHVQDLFNKKYSDVCGKPCKVPYLKGGFEVHGLPEGIPFKKPYNYGRIQLKKIMLHAHNIHFTITSTPTSTSTPASHSSRCTSTPSPASTSGATSIQTSAPTAPTAISLATTTTSAADVQNVLTI
ncbi:General transcription factor II-I repeat domain-containing protein 1, partial [Acropora cervicornis]